jgi:hypothetical protein
MTRTAVLFATLAAVVVMWVAEEWLVALALIIVSQGLAWLGRDSDPKPESTSPPGSGSP